MNSFGPATGHTIGEIAGEVSDAGRISAVTVDAYVAVVPRAISVATVARRRSGMEYRIAICYRNITETARKHVAPVSGHISITGTAGEIERSVGRRRSVGGLPLMTGQVVALYVQRFSLISTWKRCDAVELHAEAFRDVDGAGVGGLEDAYDLVEAEGVKSFAQCGSGAFSSETLSPAGRIEAPADLDGGQDFGQEHWDRQSDVPDDSFVGSLDRRPEAEAAFVPALHFFVQECAGLIACERSAVRELPDLRLGEHCC